VTHRTIRTGLALALTAATGCTANSEAATVPSHVAGQARAEAIAGDSIRFVAHDENYAVGFPSNARPLALVNPYEHNARALKTGGELFVAFNCADCHGAGGSGAMGPSLADNRWHFGGTAPAVFESIYEGRPDGMPAWGGRISNDQIWMLVTYVRSLGVGKDLTTENFSGLTVERTGH
jgi:cytochrome c oxidase cbb3-type subunit 3